MVATAELAYLDRMQRPYAGTAITWWKDLKACSSLQNIWLLLMRNAESARNLTFQVAMSSDGIERLYQVRKFPPLSTTIRYPLSCPAPYDKLLEIARPGPLKSSKVVHYGEPVLESLFWRDS